MIAVVLVAVLLSAMAVSVVVGSRQQVSRHAVVDYERLQAELRARQIAQAAMLAMLRASREASGNGVDGFDRQ